MNETIQNGDSVSRLMFTSAHWCNGAHLYCTSSVFPQREGIICGLTVDVFISHWTFQANTMNMLWGCNEHGFLLNVLKVHTRGGFDPITNLHSVNDKWSTYIVLYSCFSVTHSQQLPCQLPSWPPGATCGSVSCPGTLDTWIIGRPLYPLRCHSPPRV